jgi:predicted metal-dependent phosphoesterase TrpH
MMKIDFHVHTAERSNCATANQVEQIEAAIKHGLDVIAITDHHRLVSTAELITLNQKYRPFRILPGIEITADHEDWLVLGLSDPELEREDWAYADLHRYVRAKNGVLILAHPYRYRSDIKANLKQYTPDAVEISSINIRSDLRPRIQDLAYQLNIPTLSNSDAHASSSLGKYFNVFESDKLTDQEIFDALKSRKYHHPTK